MGREYRRETLIAGQLPYGGDIILYDDVEGVFVWTADSVEDVAIVAAEAAIIYHGSKSLKLSAATDAPAANQDGQAHRNIPLHPSKRVEVEITFRPDTAAKAKEVGIGFYFYDGTNQHTIHVYVDVNGDKVYYRTDFGESATEITAVSGKIQAERWHYMRAVFDFEADEVQEVQVDDSQVTGAEYPITSSANAADKWCDLILFNTSLDAARTETYFDDITVRAL
jgi:hypothetical protein